ncbi:winged helix-turn-helix transcriptional regulator [Streptomyces sp. NPDC001340]
MADQPVGVRPCSIAAALEILGERWTLLALREMAYGVHQFSRIAGYTGVSRDILADRLRKLEEAGIVERRQYSKHPPPYEYHLAQAGRELFPVMLALREWGDKWAVAVPPLDFRHSCGYPAVTELRCRHCEELITRETLTPLRPDRRPEAQGGEPDGPDGPRQPRAE